MWLVQVNLSWLGVLSFVKVQHVWPFQTNFRFFFLPHFFFPLSSSTSHSRVLEALPVSFKMSFKNDELTLAAALAILKWGLKILVLPPHPREKYSLEKSSTRLDFFLIYTVNKSNFWLGFIWNRFFNFSRINSNIWDTVRN